MAGEFGDAEGVRRLGQALQAAGRGLNAVASDLSGQVNALVPSGWSGSGAGTFSSDWAGKARQARRLAGVCAHVGGVLTDLAGKLDAAKTQAGRAQQMTGGPQSRFALPSMEHTSQQALGQASGAAQQARSAARGKLTGITVPKIGPALTVSQVTAWAGRLAPPSRPWYDTALHDIGSFLGGLFGGGHGSPEPTPPLANATKFVQVSPHVQVPANDPRLPQLRAAWAWASSRPVYLSGSPGDSEFTRWHDIFTVSPWARDLSTGNLARELAGPNPDYRIGGAFNRGHTVVLTTSGLGAAAFLGDPRSLIGASKETIRRLVPEGWVGPEPLKKGVGQRWWDGKGNSIMIEEGNPNTRDLGQPDSALHRGDWADISQNGIKYRIALEGNPAFTDPEAATLSIKGHSGEPQYIDEKIPEDAPGDELGDEGGGAGDEGGGAEGAGAAGE